MAQLIEQLERWIEAVIGTIGYPGIAFLMVVENILPPIPSEVVMPFSGFQVAEGHLNFFAALFAGTLGSTIGALCIYAIGYKLKRRRVSTWIRKYGKFILISEEELNKALDVFDQHGKMAVFFGRLIPGVRSLISLPAGLDGMPLPSFILLTFLGSTIWNLMLLSAGLLLHHNWKELLNFISAYETFLWAVVAAAFLFFLFHRMRQRTSSQMGD